MLKLLRHLWVRAPLFAMAGCITCLAAFDAYGGNLVWIAWLILSSAIVVLGGWRSGVIAGLVSLTLLGVGRYRDEIQHRDQAILSGRGMASVEGRLLEDANGEDGRWSAYAKLHGSEFGGCKVNWLGGGEPPPAGTEVKATGVFEGLSEARNPGSLDHAQRLRNDGVVALFRANSMRSEQWTGPISSWAARIKSGFRKSIAAGLREEGDPAKIIRAVVMGEKARDAVGLVRDFRNSGTLHVFCVSGMHVMMLGSMVWFVLKWMCIPRRWAIPLIIAAMLSYAWLTGNGPAALRASWMGAVFLGAFALRRRPDALNALGLVLIVSMFWDHRLIRLPGVQLSYGVVAAIGIATTLLRNCFSWIASEENFLPKSEYTFLQKTWLTARRKLADSLAVSTAASLGSFPLSAYHFGIITPVSIIATVALVPLVYAILAIALISSLIHPLSDDAAIFLNRGNALLAKACASSAGFFANMPGATSPIQATDAGELILYDFDYGASAACFSPGKGGSVLLDAGGKYSLKAELAPSLMRLGLRPDSVIFTHADSAHIAPIELLRQFFPIRQIASYEESNSPIPTIYPKTGQKLELGNGAWGEVLLSPIDNPLGSLADDKTLILRLHWKGWKILFQGDAGRLSEEAIVRSGIDLSSDILVLGQHESDQSLSPEWINAIKPQLIIVPRKAGCETDVYRLGRQRELREQGIRLIDQAQSGGIRIRPDSSGNLSVRGFLDKSDQLLHPRKNPE